MRTPLVVPISILALAVLPTLALPAAAQQTVEAATPTHSTSANVSLASEYRYRGIAQTDGDPAVQGGFDWTHASGVYAGTWGSNVSWLSDADPGVSSSVELDVYGGYRGTLGEFGYDVGLLRYFYPGSFPTS